MTDFSAIQAYQAAIKAAQGAAEGASTQDVSPSGPAFGNMVTEAIANTQAALQTSEAMSAAGATGEAELIDVVTAINAAELSMETVVAVRDEVIRAYKEILQMPI
jgi:flagellar hook-basal body complex protein FliE